MESRLDNNFEGVVSDGLFSFKFSSDIFIGRGGSFEGFVFSFEFNFGVSEILGSDGEESFLGVDSVDDNLEFTGGNDVLFGVISVFLLSGSDFSFEFSLESVFFVVISLEIVLDSRFDVFEGFEDSEEGRLISEFFGGELNEGLDEDFIGALGEGIDDLLHGFIDGFSLGEGEVTSGNLVDDVEAFIDGREGSVGFFDSEFVLFVLGFSFEGEFNDVGVVFIDGIIVRGDVEFEFGLFGVEDVFEEVGGGRDGDLSA